MPFEYILADLLARNERAVGALFLDPSGETIDLACSELTPYQMRILGAYLGIHLRQAEKVLGSNWLGRPAMLHVEQDQLHIYAAPLPDGYYLVLAQRPPAQVARCRKQLLEAAELLRREIFSEG